MNPRVKRKLHRKYGTKFFNHCPHCKSKREYEFTSEKAFRMHQVGCKYRVDTINAKEADRQAAVALADAKQAVEDAEAVRADKEAQIAKLRQELEVVAV